MRLIKIPTKIIPLIVNNIPCFKAVDTGILPEGIGLFCVLSIIASISRSITIFNKVEPEIANNNPSIKKISLLTIIPEVVQELIKYARIPV
jgi:hypothetical protein